jgi:hypothetical protein
MQTPHAAVTLSYWSQAGKDRNDPRLSKPGAVPLAFGPDGRFHRGTLQVPAAGLLRIRYAAPRPLRMWIGGVLAVDECLNWRHFSRRVHGAVLLPVAAGATDLLVEVGERPRHPEPVDRDCPSRNRAAVLEALAAEIPDVLAFSAEVVPDGKAPACSLRFTPVQFRRDGVARQEVLVRPLAHLFRPPTTDRSTPPPASEQGLNLRSSILPGQAQDMTRESERAAGLRRFFVPVAQPFDDPPPLRQSGGDDRVEPAHAVAREIELTVEGEGGLGTVSMPAFESVGRLAPRRERRSVAWPTAEALRAGVPRPVLPPKYAHFATLYDAAWEMFLKLVTDPPPETGAVNSYVATGGWFGLKQFVWDSSFTTLCLAYAWRVMDAHANLDNLYSRQFDGGYIHREHSWEDGLPLMWEPDFSPNPPLISIAEWQIARLSGNPLRLQQVYPALKAQHAWLRQHRRLPDGTYWTTGLANGLDNSPSLGEGYPCLSAQMAHEAEILAGFATLLGKPEEAAEFQRERGELAQAINDRLWDDAAGIYATRLPEGGHNPNKVVTAFWPLWAGVTPPQRVEALAAHLKDKRSFWRHHPIPSLAADSPHYQPGGHYWLGSTWAPTNYAAIKGFDRVGRHDLALETTLRHLECMWEVYRETGAIWENYCAEASVRGSLSGSPYCWSALGPIALLLEVLIGVEPDALARRIRWTVPAEPGWGVRNYPLGPAAVSLLRLGGAEGDRIEVRTDLPFTLTLVRNGEEKTLDCPAGHSLHERNTQP